MKLKITAFLVFQTIIISSCNSLDVHKSFKNDKLEINVSFKSVDEDKNAYYARVQCYNLSNDTLRYTNAGLICIYDLDSSRAYIDNIASNIIDYSSINFPPMDSMHFNIYFPMRKTIKEGNFKNLSIIYKHPISPIYR